MTGSRQPFAVVRNTPANFPRGRKLENPEKTLDFRKSAVFN